MAQNLIAENHNFIANEQSSNAHILELVLLFDFQSTAQRFRIKT
jgi:hypothetical protein